MKRVLLIMLAICTLASCSKDNGDETPKNIEITGGNTTQEVFADNTQGKEGVKFTTTGAWTSSIVATTKAEAPDWVSIDPASGDKAGDYTINIILTPNYTGESRKAEIKISCGSTVITITVEQKGTIESGGKPEPKLAQVSKTIYTSKSDEDNGTKPEVTLYTYDNSGRIIKMAQQYQLFSVPGIDGTPGKVVDHEMTCNVTYEGNNVKYEVSSTEENQTYSGTAKLNAKGYVESAITDGMTYQMSYNPDWQIDRVTEVNKEGEESINICRWSNGNLTTLVWRTNGEETATYSSYPNNKINLDLNWLFLQYLEGFAFLDGSDATNSLYALQNMLGVRSENYVSEYWANYNSNPNGKRHKLEYEFNNEQLPIKIKEYSSWDGKTYNYQGSMTIEYNKL